MVKVYDAHDYLEDKEEVKVEPKETKEETNGKK